MTTKLILASASRFRQQLLSSAGINAQAISSQGDEHSVTHFDPRQLAQLRARFKASDVAMRYRGALVLGVDQVLSLGGKPLDKVTSAGEARQRLMAMSGKTHKLCNGMCLMSIDEHGTEQSYFDTCIDVTMSVRPLTEIEVDSYIEQEAAWQHSVACYYYEGLGINLFDHVGGDHSTVIGLPLVPLLAELRKLGIAPLRDGNH